MLRFGTLCRFAVMYGGRFKIADMAELAAGHPVANDTEVSLASDPQQERDVSLPLGAIASECERLQNPAPDKAHVLE